MGYSLVSRGFVWKVGRTGRVHSVPLSSAPNWPIHNQPNPRVLVAVPIFNEGKSVNAVLGKILSFARDVLVVDDGSSDDTPTRLKAFDGLHVVTHPVNRGYGAALISAFDFCVNPPPGVGPFDGLVTLDCDGQHEPERIDLVARHLLNADIVSASRYLTDFPENDSAPADRRRVNSAITEKLNRALGLHLTDAFCGFKAYRNTALSRLKITEPGWGMPLQLWVQAARLALKIQEVAIPRIYLDPTRTFGTGLTDADTRMRYYNRVIEDALAAAPPYFSGTARDPSPGLTSKSAG